MLKTGERRICWNGTKPMMLTLGALNGQESAKVAVNGETARKVS
jgi:hypothetical protein